MPVCSQGPIAAKSRPSPAVVPKRRHRRDRPAVNNSKGQR
jgi:hypothetical protein